MYNQPENEPEFVTVYHIFEDYSYDGCISIYYTFSEEKANKKLEELREAVKYVNCYKLQEIKVEK